MGRNPHVLACDAGSTDAGPYYLGSGRAFVSRAACKRDAELLIANGWGAGIPVIFGSAGGGGGESGVTFLVDIVKEIAVERELHFKVAVIHAEQRKDYLKIKLKQGKITSLGVLPELTESDIDAAEHVVGVMGPEPIIKALDMGAEIVIAGRASDSAIFAAVPLRKGYPPGVAWHAGKILECGAASAEPAADDCILVTMSGDSFLVEPLNPDLRHTVLSVGAHALYENASPFHIHEPGGVLDLTNAVYEQFNEGTVRVTGGQFLTSPAYRVKLEAATRIGYRTIAIMGTRDPVLIGQINDYLALVRQTVEKKVRDVFDGRVAAPDYQLIFRVYGRNGVMGGWEPVKVPQTHELGILIEVVSTSQELANAILAFARTFTVHHDFPGRLCTGGNMAIPFSPSDIPVGPAYRFNIDHLVEVNDPCEMFEIELLDV